MPNTVLNSNMMKICQALSQEKFLEEYYLAGGTALAIQIKHRKSLDLDFFSQTKINVQRIIDFLYRCFPENCINILFRKSDQLDVNIMGVKTSFISYPFKLINGLVDGRNAESGFGKLKMASPEEIALMKAYAIGRRTSFRDYVDIYYLLSGNLTTIPRIIRECERKYVLEGEKIFSGKLFLQQLKYTEDIEDKRETENFILDKTVNSEIIESYLNAAVNRHLRKQYTEREDAN